METVSSVSQSPKRFPTKRQLYFFLLWLPFPAHVLYLITAVFHVSFGVVHCWNARRKPTQKLLRDSWQVPFKVAAVTFLENLLMGATPGASWSWSFELRNSGGFALVMFLGALSFLAFGWLLLLTVARRWPLDASQKPVSSVSKALSG